MEKEANHGKGEEENGRHRKYGPSWPCQRIKGTIVWGNEFLDEWSKQAWALFSKEMFFSLPLVF